MCRCCEYLLLNIKWFFYYKKRYNSKIIQINSNTNSSISIHPIYQFENRYGKEASSRKSLKKKRKRKRGRTLHVARGLQRNKKTSVVIVLEGGKPKWWAREGRSGGVCYRGEWLGRREGDWSKTWVMAMPAAFHARPKERNSNGYKGWPGRGGGGFDSSKNCTFFSPIEWPGRHLNTLCVFHPWG